MSLKSGTGSASFLASRGSVYHVYNSGSGSCSYSFLQWLSMKNVKEQKNRLLGILKTTVEKSRIRIRIRNSAIRIPTVTDIRNTDEKGKTK
jgi:hypothetical protein